MYLVALLKDAAGVFCFYIDLHTFFTAGVLTVSSVTDMSLFSSSKGSNFILFVNKKDHENDKIKPPMFDVLVL